MRFNYVYFIILIIFFLIGGYYMNFDYIYFGILVIPFIHLFFFQIKKFQIDNPDICLKIFKSNNIFGLIVFINILIAKNL